MTGTIIKVITKGGFGFIRGDDPRIDYFFHVREMGHGITFDETLVGRTVRFEAEDAFPKPRAVRVWLP